MNYRNDLNSFFRGLGSGNDCGRKKEPRLTEEIRSLGDLNATQFLSPKTFKRLRALERFKRILGPEKYHEWHEREDTSIVDSNPTAKCFDCKQDLPRSAFYRHKINKNGLSHICIECFSLRNRKRVRR